MTEKVDAFCWTRFSNPDLPGIVCSLSIISTREKDNQGPWKMAVAYRTNDVNPLATKLLEFEVTMETLKG